MQGFELLLGHLIGDYILQNDWMASNKTTRTWPCFVHCIFYTLAIAMTCWSWFPLWGYGVVFALHYPVDRFRLARVWMERVSGQKTFANGPLAPWSIIIVDNIAHLIVLYAVAIIAGVS